PAAADGAASRVDADPSRPARRTRGAVVWIGLVLAAIACAIGMFAFSDPLLVGALGVVELLLLMALRLPVAAALALAGIVGIGAIAGPNVVLDSITTRPFVMASSWSLSVLPMFILMSFLLANSGATTRIYNAARA